MKNKKLEQYAQMLLQWNQIHALSGAKNQDEVLKNIKSSLYPLEIKELNLAKKSLLLDIGSGNGFPAVPLGIMLGIPTILCEPNAKKAAFLQNLKAYLNLENFIIKKQKVESLRLEKAPDLITSRATFSTEILLNKCKHLITKDSMLLLFKGQNVKNEIPANLAYSCYETSSFNYLVILGENIC